MNSNKNKNGSAGHGTNANAGDPKTPLVKRHTSAGMFEKGTGSPERSAGANKKPEHEEGHHREHVHEHEAAHGHEHEHDGKEGKDKDTAPNEDKAKKAAEMREALKKKAEKANLDAVSQGVGDMRIFHPSNMGGMETTGKHANAFKPDEGSVMIKGRNIGAGRSEPNWTIDQLKAIREATSAVLEVTDVKESRISKPDPEGKFVTRDEEEGTIVAMEAAHLSSMSPSMYKLGAGPMKYGSTGGPGIYVDVVVIAKDETWMLNQVTSANVVIDGVKEDILKKPAKMGNKRRIGHDFARVGLPKYSLGAIFNTLQSKFPGVLSEVKQTPGYYWLNASWGVSTMKGTFAYLGEDNEIHKTQVLSDIMMMNRGRSSLATATIAISISFKATRSGEDWVPIMETAGLSVKLHNAVQHDAVDWHGPEQTGAGGMFISKQMASTLKPVRMPATMGMGGIANTAPAKGLFSNIGKPAPGLANTGPAMSPDDVM